MEKGVDLLHGLYLFLHLLQEYKDTTSYLQKSTFNFNFDQYLFKYRSTSKHK
jgi:hypothetical protein